MESSRQEEESVMDIKELCVLCKSMPCCPEHCCNVSLYISFNSKLVGHLQLQRLSTGTEEITKIKKQKDNKFNGQGDSEIKNKELLKPSEQTRANDGALIINYEVPIEEEEEKVALAGGIKGIRALRMQRDAINDQVQENLQAQTQQYSSAKFSKYEESKR